MSTTMASVRSERAATMSRLLQWVARQRRLDAEDRRDFVQWAHLRLLERDYDLFDRFEGRSSLQTFLTVAASRLLLDWRNARFGKWRTSAAATRLGPTAVLLERRVYRDGLPLDQAVDAVRADDPTLTRAGLEALFERLPPRLRLRMVAPDECGDEIEAPPFDDPIEAEDRARQARAVRRALALAMGELSDEERELLRLRFVHGRAIPSLARAFDTDAGSLYRRFYRLFAQMRASIEKRGVMLERRPR